MAVKGISWADECVALLVLQLSSIPVNSQGAAVSVHSPLSLEVDEFHLRLAVTRERRYVFQEETAEYPQILCRR